MNSKIKVNEGKFELTILGAFSLAILYYCIPREFISIPFYALSKSVSSDKIIKSILDVLKYLIPYAITIILLLKNIREDYKKDFKISYFRKFNFKLLLCTIFSMIGLYLCIQSSIGSILDSLPVPKIINEGFKELDENLYLGITIAIITGPIVEEIVLRGIILEGLLNKYKPAVSIIVSAIIFGGIHMNLPQFINATMLGILFGYIYYKTKSVGLCIACHMINNTIADFEINFSIITLVIGIVMLVTATVFFERCLKKMKHDDADLKKNIA